MGVYIKDMKMPSRCCECELEVGRYMMHECMWINDYTNDVRENGKLENCPLTEVKEPHGDLIDRDIIKTNMIQLSFSVRNWIDEVTLDTRIPVVIKAEGMEE